MNSLYPPKNRIDNPLQVTVLKIDHKDGTINTDPNSILISAVTTADGSDPHKVELMTAKGSEFFNFTELKPLTNQFSILSGFPAIRYRAEDVEILLTPEECFRLSAHSLLPEEYFKLRDHYGDFFEIHDDFYNPDSGDQFQPLEAEFPVKKQQPNSSSRSMH